jgi:hypothetical protein
MNDMTSRQWRTEVRRLRVAAGYTQEQAAQLMGWSLSKITRLEGGQASPGPDGVGLLLKAYGVTSESVLAAIVDAVRATAPRRGRPPAGVPKPVDAPKKNGPTPHGTASGAARHVKRKERACPACRQAKNEYDRDWSKRTENMAKRKARFRAASRLRAQFLGEYNQLRQKEVDRILEGQGERKLKPAEADRARRQAKGRLRARFHEEFDRLYRKEMQEE